MYLQYQYCSFLFALTHVKHSVCWINWGKNLGNRGFFCLWRCDPTRVVASSFLRFLDHTQPCTAVGRTPLDEWSARRRDLYLTTHNTHNRQTSMPPVGFEPTISSGERPQTYALDRATIGTGCTRGISNLIREKLVNWKLLRKSWKKLESCLNRWCNSS